MTSDHCRIIVVNETEINHILSFYFTAVTTCSHSVITNNHSHSNRYLHARGLIPSAMRDRIEPMSCVVQMFCHLTQPPVPLAVPGINLRAFRNHDDTLAWLNLRDRAFARERLGVRSWTIADFAAEFLHKPWWSPDRMWLAEAATPEQGAHPSLVGAVALAERCGRDEARPVVHWLMVHPAWRRRGIARALMSALHADCWQQKRATIWLETHADWGAARRFYESIGYRTRPNEYAEEKAI